MLHLGVPLCAQILTSIITRGVRTGGRGEGGPPTGGPGRLKEPFFFSAIYVPFSVAIIHFVSLYVPFFNGSTSPSSRVATRWAKWPKVGSLKSENGPFQVGYFKKGPF